MLPLGEFDYFVRGRYSRRWNFHHQQAIGLVLNPPNAHSLVTYQHLPTTFASNEQVQSPSENGNGT